MSLLNWSSLTLAPNGEEEEEEERKGTREGRKGREERENAMLHQILSFTVHIHVHVHIVVSTFCFSS